MFVKKSWFLTILFLFILLLAACSSSSTSGSNEQDTDNSETDNEASTSEAIVLQLGHNAPVDSAVGIGASTLKEKVEEITNGQITIEIFPNAELGDEVSMIENMGLGVQDMVLTGDGMFGTFFPDYEGLLLPFLIKDSEHMDRIYQGEIGDEMSESLVSQVNSRILSSYHRGGRNLTANKPITSPEDLDKFKLRLPPIGFIEEAWALFGANPTQMDFGELYVALQQGTVDGQENPVDPIYTSNFYEVQSHLMWSQHTHSPLFYLINEDVYQGFSDELRAQFDQAVEESVQFMNDRLEEEEQRMLDSLAEEGMQIVEFDQEPFRKIVEESGLAEKYEDKWADNLIQRVRDQQ